MVRVDREEWRAETVDGAPIAAGTIVQVVEVQGTRVIVAADTRCRSRRDHARVARAPLDRLEAI